MSDNLIRAAELLASQSAEDLGFSATKIAVLKEAAELLEELSRKAKTLAAPSVENLGVSVPKMASIKESAVIYNLPVHFIRRLVSEGKVFSVKAGRKYLVNCGSLSAYLNGEGAANVLEKPLENAPRITPISLR